MPVNTLFDVERLSLLASGGQSGSEAVYVLNSGAGRYTAFGATGNDLLGTEALGRQIYVRDNETGRLELASRTMDGLAPDANTQVYQPYGTTTTMRMMHAMRTPIVSMYCRTRVSASSRGAARNDVADWGAGECFTVLPDYAAAR